MDCEMATCFTHITPTARFEHRCCECGGIIHRGEKYHRISGIWDNYPSRHKVCVDCEEIRDALNKTACCNDNMVAFDNLFYELTEKENSKYMAMFILNARARRTNVKAHLDYKLNPAQPPIP